jgi:hypothetical protein
MVGCEARKLRFSKPVTVRGAEPECLAVGQSKPGSPEGNLG